MRGRRSLPVTGALNAKAPAPIFQGRGLAGAEVRAKERARALDGYSPSKGMKLKNTLTQNTVTAIARMAIIDAIMVQSFG